MVKVPGSMPGAVGLNTTLMVQAPLADRATLGPEPQLPGVAPCEYIDEKAKLKVSGMLPAVRVTVCIALVAPTATEPKSDVVVTDWPTAIAAPRRRRRTVAHKVLFKIVGTLWDCIAVLLKLFGLVDDKFPGVNQHHHQHAAGENIVGGDFALVV